MNKSLKQIKDTQVEIEKLSHMYALISFDESTICPIKGKHKQQELLQELAYKVFKLQTDKQYIENIKKLNTSKDKLSYEDRLLIEYLYKQIYDQRNFTDEFVKKMNKVYSESNLAWHEGKAKAKFEIFKPHLIKVIEIEKEKAKLISGNQTNLYNTLLDQYEKGMTKEDLDIFFENCKKRIIPLLKKITSSTQVNDKFMSRKCPIYKQEEFSKKLLKIISFDFTRGQISTSEHPYTSEMSKDDIRITTHYYENNFISNVFSVIHEGGHAIFAQNQPKKDYRHFISNHMSLGMHESVSRFYENRIGRSYEFIKDIIYPNINKFFPTTFKDVSLEDLYRGINKVEPSLIRTEADELTYTLHIIIRYEIEKELIDGNLNIDDLPQIWNQKYEEYLGIKPNNDKEGILQDIHWSSGFGYFPTYALGNAYNSMYYKKLEQEVDIKNVITSKNLTPIKIWLKNNVFKDANHLTAKQWIKSITNKDFSADDFLDYLEGKYSKIYNL